MTIPLAFVSDYLLHHAVPDWLQIFAAVGVLLGFAMVNVAGIRQQRHVTRQNQPHVNSTSTK